MLPYSRGLILENSSDYGVVKTEALFGFGPSSRSDHYDRGDAMQWILTPVNVERSLKELPKSVASTTEKPNTQIERATKKQTNKSDKQLRSKKRKAKKVNKCIIKFLKNKEKRRGGSGKRRKVKLMKSKYFMPMILGLLAAKSVLIPVALKALAFMSAKGLMMGFFATVMASVLSLKGMFDNTPKYHDRKDERTQVEIIQVPTKEDHYVDDHYRRTDFLPLPLPQ